MTDEGLALTTCERSTLTVEAARAALQEFLARNPNSTIDEIDIGSESGIGIKNPWGDDSLVICIPEELTSFSESINNLLLPERYTAIWHSDTRDFEIIWTAFSIAEQWRDVIARSFCFQHEGKNYQCEFSTSSDRLLAIADGAVPLSASGTAHRNLPSFSAYMAQKKEKRARVYARRPIDEPLSFWIRDVDWNEDLVLNLVMHLNFYMIYFDSFSPEIIIHTPSNKGGAFKPTTRYVNGTFPSHVTSQRIDNNLLHYWAASRTGDSARRFQYLYRIIEYSGSYHLDSRARQALKKILTAPNLLSDMNGVIENIIAALPPKRDDGGVLLNILRDTANTAILWREIASNITAFKNETVFDGGLTVGPLAPKGLAGEQDFLNNGLERFAATIKDIRNALAHGREQKTKDVALPTVGNFEKLRPWVSLLQVAARDVMIYRQVV